MARPLIVEIVKDNCSIRLVAEVLFIFDQPRTFSSIITYLTLLPPREGDRCGPAKDFPCRAPNQEGEFPSELPPLAISARVYRFLAA